ncbi:hypothetical protein ACH41E_11470 [Streptomyces sp. NPDC020412]|uniref:hypothetical protein n=1 Tax=Streptomyces sp. NPDC020412 TaxID=3365073 RepID=UPI0037B55EED
MPDSENADDNAARIATAWHTLTEWLAEHAPRSYAQLLPPATDDEIREAETVLAERAWHPDGGEPLTFPEDLRTLWRLCGGFSVLLHPRRAGGQLRGERAVRVGVGG